MNIEIAERIAKGNRAYYANAKLIKSKFLKKNDKMKINKTMTRPVVTYSSETCTLTAKDENNLSIIERQILRKIQGGSNMTGNDLCVNKCKQSRSYLNHLAYGPVNTDNIQGVTGGTDQTSGGCSLR